MINLRTLGVLRLEQEGARASSPLVHEPVRLAVLLYLTGSRSGYCTRDRLLGLLWPDSPRGRALSALRQAVHRIRTCLGGDVLLTRGHGDLELNQERVAVDVLHFRHAVARQDHASVLTLYQGRFLPGFSLTDRPEFNDWAESKRVELSGLARTSAVCMAEAAEDEGDYHGAADQWKRAAELSWYDEVLLRRWMTALVACGSPASAMETYRRAAAVLKERMGMVPADETSALAQRIRSRGRSADLPLA